MDMKEPIPFLTTDPNGSFQFNPGAVEILDQISGPISIVSIVGSGRTGKSYIMNRLFNTNQGFKLGGTTEAETKGIWMWAKPHPLDSNITLVLLDSEGLNDPEKADDQHDLKVFSLILLLSCTMIYNVVGKLDEAIVRELHLVTELTKHIKISDDNNEETGKEFEKYFPKLHFLVRDMFLEPKVNGKAVTPKQYMENALKPKEAAKEQESNKSRKCIAKYFPERDCHLLSRPIDDEETLQHLEEVNDKDLKDKFTAQCKQFVEKVLKWAKPKFEGDNFMNGARYVKLTTCYVNAINDNGIPCVKRAVEVVKEEQITRATQEAKNLFQLEMYKGLKGNIPMENDKLSQLLDNANERARTHFIQNQWYDSVDDEMYLENLMAELQHYTKELRKENKQQSRQKCEQILADATDKLQTKRLVGKYYCPGGSQKYKRDKEDAINEYKNAAHKGPMADHVLNEYLENAEKEEKIIVQQDINLTEEKKKRFLEEEKKKQEEIKKKEALQRLQEELQERSDKEKNERARQEQRTWKEKFAEYKEALISGGVGTVLGTGVGVGVGSFVGRAVGVPIGAAIGVALGLAPGAAAGAAIGGVIGSFVGGAGGAGIGQIVKLIMKKAKEKRDDED